MNTNKLLPANSLYSTQVDKAVKLRASEDNLQKYPPQSIYSIFTDTVQGNPDHNALMIKADDGNWNAVTYADYFQNCKDTAKSFIKIGLEKNECVSIIGFNAAEWNYSCLGATFAGGISCGLYTTNSVEICDFIIGDSNTTVLVVENDLQLKRLLKLNNLPKLKAIIQYHGSVDNSNESNLYDWNSFIKLGNDVPDDALNERIQTIAPNRCNCLVYTSGTTGKPKGVMLSHDSLTYNSLLNEKKTISLDSPRYSARIVSYLPLSHASAQIIDIYMSILTGATLYFAQPDALRGSLGETIKEVRPTLFFGVPRVWEKFQEKMEPILKKMNPKLVFDDNTKKMIQTQMGLEQANYLVTGAAPITNETLNFFANIGLPLHEVYGMSETAGPHAITTTEHYRKGSVGKVDKELFLTKLINKDDESNCGELCMYGRHLMMGYLNNGAKTEETFDNDWLRSGDLATIDNDDFIFITGRLKELIITAGGENVAPIPIEDNVKSLMPDLIRNCMLIGDKRKFLTIILCLKNKVDLTTMAMQDELEDDCVKFLKSIGSNSTKASQIIDGKDQVVSEFIEKSLVQVNKLAVSRATNVQKFTILNYDFSIPGGELGPTLKLMRPQVCKIHAAKIDAMYNS